MEKSKRGIGRVALYGGVIGALVLSALPAGAPSAAAQGQTRKINNFDVSGRFLEEWSKQGSEQNNVYVNGLPITARRPEISMTDGKTYETQWFERARFEAHPENRAPYDVLLGLLGVTLTEGRGSVDPATKRVRNPADQPFVGIDKPADADGRTKVWFPETRHSVSGKILEYWNRYGGLQQFGFPLSEQFAEISATDGKTYQVQYFERNRFELHPEKQAPYEVELGLLGVQQFKTTPVPASELPFAPPANVQSKKDTLVVAFSQEPNSLYSLAENAYVVTMAADNIEDALVVYDHKDNIVPQNAWYVPTLENGGSFYVGAGDDRHLVTKYKIRRGIKWSDGQELDSNDAVFAYKLIMDPKSPVVDRSLWQKLANVDNPDKYTVVYNWMSSKQAADFLNRLTPGDRPNYSFLQQFVDEKRPVVDPVYMFVGSIYPEHVLSRIPADKIIESGFARNPIGTGPFKVERWTSGQELVLTQNENYTLTAKPLLKRIVIRFIADTNQIIAQLRTGDLDGATSDAFPAPIEALEQLGAGQTVVYQPARVWEHIDFNFTYGPFQDRAVREAMITGLNRQRIVDVALRGKSVVLHTVQPPASWVSLQNEDFARKYANRFTLPRYNFDQAKANQLLDAAGWVRGADGIRAKGGQKLQFEYATTAGNALRQTVTQLAQADWKAIGIDAQLKYYAAGTEYFAEGGILDRGVCQLCEFAWVLGADPSFSQWEISQIPDPAKGIGGTNYQRYRNPKVTELSQAFSGEIDRNKREPIGAEVQVELAKDIALIPLFPRLNIEVHKANLENWRTSAGTVSPFYNIPQVYFK